MLKEYLLGIIIGAISGLTVMFFSQGGIKRYKLFIWLIKRNGKWLTQRIIIFISSILISIYGIFLYGFCREFIGFELLCTYLLAMAITDIRSKQIPDDCTLTFAILFIIFSVSSLNIFLILNSLFGFLVAGILPFLAYNLKKDSIGFGDVKLLSICGIISGFPEIIYIITKGLIFIFVYSCIMIILKKVSLKAEMPLAPFILIGALI